MKIVEPGALEAAAQEAAAANAIVSDPNVDAKLGVPHLQRAWQALARACGQTGELQPWVAATPLPGLAPVRRGVLAREVGALFESPSNQGARELQRHVDDFRKVCTALGSSSGAPRSGWAWQTLAWIGAALVLTVITVRPWQANAVGPWRAAYYASEHFDGKPIMRRYAEIDFHWGTGAPYDVVPGDLFSAYFDTCLTVDTETTVVFQVVSDDGSRVYLDGKRVIDNWGKHAIRSRGGTVKVKPGTHHLRIKYFEDARDAELHLMASFDPNEPPAQIPVSMLSYPSGSVDAPNPCAG